MEFILGLSITLFFTVVTIDTVQYRRQHAQPLRPSANHE